MIRAKALPARMRGAIAGMLRPRSRVRRYLRPDTGVPEFFVALKRQSCCYVVLRWFDELPYVAPGEDLDLLVADRDLPIVAGLMHDATVGQPCDVYTVSGIDRTTYRRRPYFPGHLARQILDRAEWRQELFRVPCPEDHFLSLAYHAVYHKGPASGLAAGSGRAGPSSAPPEHDYAGLLAKLAADLGFSARLSLESLDEFLNSRGFRPDRDTLWHLRNGNEWIGWRFFSAT
jgi:hypothetical protein